MFYDTTQSPLGTLTIATDGTHITALHIEGDRYFTAVPKDWKRDSSQPALQKAKAQLDEYFAGTRETFDLPLHAEGTEFQKAVWHALQSIAPGQTTTYGQLADKIGKPTAVRAVGTAIGRNPICIVVPCHRVLAGDGSLGGYVAGVERKQALLDLETR